MHIVYLSQYFPPEMGASASRVSEMAQHWVKAGEAVTVFTGFPQHPTGIKPPKYRRKIWMREIHNDVNVLRTYIYAAPNKGYFRRVLSYLSFMCSSLVLGPFLLKRGNVLIATSPQFLVAVSGCLLSMLMRCRFVFEVRDLWPESIVSVGAMKRGLLIRFLEKVEAWLYRRADRITVVTRRTKSELVRRGIPEEKIWWIPNCVDYKKFEVDDERVQSLREKLGLKGKFVIGYIGTLGMAHGLETMIKAAERLQKVENLVFLFVGDGADRANLEAQATDLNLRNILFAGEQPREDIPCYLRICDLSAILLKDKELFRTTIPSKIFECMAAARPILLGVDGEARDVLESAGAGWYFKPEDDAAMADTLEQLLESRDELQVRGLNGKKFVREHYNRALWAQKYLDCLKEVALS